MAGTCVIGLQWGDEAKGKIVDLLTPQNEIVVRYQGGANAGHTVVFGGKKYKLSLIPSGIFRTEVQCVIAGGVVLHPESILREIDTLATEGIAIGKNLMISDRVHIIFPWHTLEDAILNNLTGSEAIGTTMRGIGPCYRDKVGRSLALRLGDLYRSDLRERIAAICESKMAFLRGAGSSETLDAAKIFDDYSAFAARLRPFVADTTDYLLNAVDRNAPILLEGAQGSLLDVDHGTFPFVTSSNSSGVGVAAGSGIPASFVTRMIGVMKAYTTRVGGGPFPTEQDNETGVRIREQGNEYGTVTRRPRRCGWFDAVAARYTTRLAGVTELVVSLLDVLSGFDKLNVCTAYRLGGKEIRHFPSQIADLRAVEPVYETLEGWQEDITGVRRFSDLPRAAQVYVRRLETLVGRRVGTVSVGPDREQTIAVE
ncbi:MAG: adenylosuccinate synthase [Thermoguttaceae bacterium]